MIMARIRGDKFVGKVRKNSIQIGNSLVEYGKLVFIIVDIGVNHNGDIDLAYELIPGC